MLECKLCQHKDKDELVNHIKTEHADETTLKSYMAKHGGRASVMSSAMIAAHFGAATAGEVEFMGKKYAVAALTDEMKTFIPEVDKNYVFEESRTQEIMYHISKGKPVALSGHCGTGKTSLVYQIAAKIEQPVMRINANQQITVSDFIGRWTVKGGEMEWIDGALPWAMRNGVWLIIDEVDYAEPAILSALNAVLERNGTLMLADNGNEIVKAAGNFRIFATGNTLGQMQTFRHLYQGTNLMNEAFIDRFHVFLVDYLKPTDEAKLIEKKVDGMTPAMATRISEFAAAVRKAFTEETLSCSFSTRRVLDWAEMVVYYKAMKRDAMFKAAESTVFSKVSKEDALAIRGIMERVFLTNS